MTVHIRPAQPSDAEACGRIIHDAFKAIAERHNFPPDFPDVKTATELARAFVAHPAIYGVVAEADGRVVGSNFLSEGDPIRAVGPITVDPRRQDNGVGKQLMKAVIERGRGSAGIRLLQAGYHMRSLSLYASLGFEVREPVVVMSGRPKSAPVNGAAVRRMTAADVASCDALYQRVHGISRANEIADAVRMFTPVVLERDGRIAGYLTHPSVWLMNHGVAESDDNMKALLLGAAALQAEPLSFLLPTRQSGLFRWCLAEGLQSVMPMTLMTMGQYKTPAGSYMPSVLY
ncbi:MAG TPA: GNAT family N-acetyltransferase [Alphaproteobacteria bacterium]|nr:GNAT family N-acetyltransferase [Alphaproteobacteria bacterium]